MLHAAGREKTSCRNLVCCPDRTPIQAQVGCAQTGRKVSCVELFREVTFEPTKDAALDRLTVHLDENENGSRSIHSRRTNDRHRLCECSRVLLAGTHDDRGGGNHIGCGRDSRRDIQRPILSRAIRRLIGGRIANQAKNGNTTTLNIYFDRRFSQNGFAPPWYPSTTVTTSGSNSATMTTTIQRTKWFNRTTY